MRTDMKRAGYVETIEKLENDLKKTSSPEWADRFKNVLKGHYERLAKYDAAKKIDPEYTHGKHYRSPLLKMRGL